MIRWSGTTWQFFSICLLLVATSGPNLHHCVPRLLAEEEHRQSGCHEEDRTKELLVNAAYRQRIESRTGLPRNWAAPRPCDPTHVDRRNGQVSMADALRGERRLHNGCGAELLR
jgi:hypothetical protein